MTWCLLSVVQKIGHQHISQPSGLLGQLCKCILLLIKGEDHRPEPRVLNPLRIFANILTNVRIKALCQSWRYFKDFLCGISC